MARRQSTDRQIAQAQRLIEQDQLDAARILLEAAARQDETDARPWLLLAGIAPSARERRAFLAQAERLKAAPAGSLAAPLRAAPGGASVATPATIAFPAPLAARNGGNSALTRMGLIVLLAIVLALGAYLLVQSPVGQALMQDDSGETAVAQTTAPETGGEAIAGLGDETAPEPGLPTPTLSAGLAAGFISTSDPTDAPPATDEPADEGPLLPEKDVAGEGQPLATWTVTAEPTPTLAPTATPTATPEPSPTPVPPPPGSPRPYGVGETEKWIDVNLTTQTLTAYEGDTPVLTTLISSGQWQYATVTGEYRTYLKYDMQTMSGYHLGLDYVTTDVPHVMYFFRDFAIHGAYWHNSFGTPVSHGCVNAPPPEAAWLYEWAPLGTFVTVHY